MFGNWGTEKLDRDVGGLIFTHLVHTTTTERCGVCDATLRTAFRSPEFHKLKLVCKRWQFLWNLTVRLSLGTLCSPAWCLYPEGCFLEWFTLYKARAAKGPLHTVRPLSDVAHGAAGLDVAET
jgi:hypothetical protein